MKKFLPFLLTLLLAVCLLGTTAVLAAELQITGGQAISGDTVEVTISVTDNPGFAAMVFTLEFDPEKLTLTNLLPQIGADALHATDLDTANADGLLRFLYLTTDSITQSGVLATLQFQVASGIQSCRTPLTLDLEQNVYDLQENIIDFALESSSVYISDIRYGDVDSNGEINVLDVLLIVDHFLNPNGANAGQINLAAADVNANGRIDLPDALRLLKYVSGWDVILGGDAPEDRPEANVRPDFDPAPYTSAMRTMNALGILDADAENAAYYVRKEDAVLALVKLVTGKTDTESWNDRKTSLHFNDVTAYGRAIDYAVETGLTSGKTSTRFGFGSKMTFGELAAMGVRALGYATADMEYPYGFLLAAQKLLLCENINLSESENITLAELAQFLWDLANTQIAVTDPTSGTILYPGEIGMTESLNPEYRIERETLMEQRGYILQEMLFEIMEFYPAADAGETDIVRAAIYDADNLTLCDEMDIAAADLGIDLATARKTDYCGKFICAMIDCPEEDFYDKYSTDADETEASIKLATPVALTHVDNIAAANIRYDADRCTLTLGGEKFRTDDPDVMISFAMFDAKDGIWTTARSVNVADFTYTTKYGYTGEDSTYYVADYAVIDFAIPDYSGNTTDRKAVLIYLTPVAFGQYVERELKYSPTGKTETFKLVAECSDVCWTNLDGEESFWVEKTLNGTRVTSATKTLTKTQGQASYEVTVEGVEVKSGDFFFGSYNGVDNVLTAYKNVGRFETGRLTAKNSVKRTVKIDGTDYAFGFEDVFGFEGMATYDNDSDDELYGYYIADLETGEDNVKYLLCDGKIVYIERYHGEPKEIGSYPFVLISTNPKDVADVLDITDSKYEDNLTGAAEGYDGWYIADNGYVAVAVMNTETGKLELGYIKGIAYEYDAEDDEFDKTYDLANLAKYTDLMGDGYTKFEDYADASDTLLGSTIFAVVEEKNGVYSVADIKQWDGQFNGGYIVDYWDGGADLIFSDISPKTNVIKATSDVDVEAARVTLNDDTIIVAFDGKGNLMARKGIQTEKYSLSDCIFHAASPELIVVYTEEDLNCTYRTDARWDHGSAHSVTEYYLVLGDEGCEYEVDDDGMFTLSAYNLFNIATLEKVESIVMTGDTEDKSDVNAKNGALKAVKMGAIVKFEDGRISEADDLHRALLETEAYEDYCVINDPFVFSDDCTLYGVPDHKEDRVLAGIDMKVVTVNLTGLDEEDYDFSEFALDREYGYGDYSFDEIVVENRGMCAYAYPLLLDNTITEIHEPTFGVLNQDIIDAAFNGERVLIHADGDGFDDEYAYLSTLRVDLCGVERFDEKTGTIDVVIFKFLLLSEE